MLKGITFALGEAPSESLEPFSLGTAGKVSFFCQIEGG